eukprot:14159331-Ditylum_brightwellii.AAC.1
MERVKGWTPDTSSLLHFHWYQWAYYLGEYGETILCRWSSTAEKYSDGDSHWFLPISGHPVVCSTVWPVPDDDILNPTKTDQQKSFGKAIRNHLGGTLGELKSGDLDEDDLVLEPRNLFEDDEDDKVIEQVKPDAMNKDPDDYKPDAHDEYLGAEVLLPRGGEMHMGTIKRQ